VFSLGNVEVCGFEIFDTFVRRQVYAAGLPHPSAENGAAMHFAVPEAIVLLVVVLLLWGLNRRSA
jgi:hypothetical protein